MLSPPTPALLHLRMVEVKMKYATGDISSCEFKKTKSGEGLVGSGACACKQAGIRG